MYTFFRLLLALLVSGSALAQSVMTGQVYDAQTKEPLPGVTLTWSRGTAGVTTDANGRFFSPTGNAMITVSAVGYRQQEVAVMLGQPLRIALEPAIEDLQTVVVTGNREAALRTQTSMIRSGGRVGQLRPQGRSTATISGATASLRNIPSGCIP